MGRDLANNNPPQENRTCLQSAVSSSKSSLVCLKTALGASPSSHVSLTQRQSQVGQGNLPWSLPWWLQPSQLRAGITPAPPKKHPMRDKQGANSRSPALLCQNHTSPGAELVQSPAPAVESGLGLRARGCAGSSLLISTTSPVPKPELCHCRGHLSQGRELHSCLPAGVTFMWTETSPPIYLTLKGLISASFSTTEM